MTVDRQWIDTVPPVASGYWARVRTAAADLGSDGCTCSPDIHVDACYEHDVHWRTGATIYGAPITTQQANRRLWKVMCDRSPLKGESFIARVYWLGVTIGAHFVQHHSR